MWWLLRTMCFVHVIGNIFCLLKPKLRNPEANMNISEIISHWNYKSEVYEVVTDDGYILLLYRIPMGKNEPRNSSTKPVVYLQHGLTLSASAWLINPPSSSLGFLLADAHFDVWLGNVRGNNYARKHVYLDPNSTAFWNFSFDEQIKFDIPATIDFIVNKTGQKQIYYVGHSQGTLLAYGALATNPQLAQKIKANLALGPVVTTKYLSGAFRTIAYIDPTVIKKVFGEKDIMTSPDGNRVLQFVCHRETMGTVCNNLLAVLFGYNPKNLNESRIDVYAGHIPSGTSVRNILHFSQGIRTGLFQTYNWGSDSLNMQHYNQFTPPIYKVENMKVQTVIWSGGQDILANPIDVKNLVAKTYNLVYHKKISDYNHLDFIIGKDAAEKVYNDLIAFIKKDQSG
ncbi:LOW QUALITY PROTEIN: tear acid lipase-like protein [Onychomys torridus]|uniref:LOW QUALITY PROTEIN: tear acid lipase-like protein n=1 Tax=Onychomys torridus TaxID=38674 RepID=UPI00167F2813|nr:LOW QUALITY PROTEIN: tear acid lipase-like protein [Onychomys torridus]